MIKAQVFTYEEHDMVKIRLTTDSRNAAIIVDELSDVFKCLAQAHIALHNYQYVSPLLETSDYLCTKFVDLMEVIEKDDPSTKDKESGGA